MPTEDVEEDIQNLGEQICDVLVHMHLPKLSELFVSQAQTLASLLIHMPRRSLLHVHSVLLQMIRQNFVVPADSKTESDLERSHVWEVRHAGLLGIKYEVAVRNDLFDNSSIKTGDEQNILRGVVGAAILGYVGSFPRNFIPLTAFVSFPSN